MVFSSSIFLFCFLPITLAVYYITPYKIKNYVLLVASLIFYWWGEPKFVLVMLTSIVVNYVFGLAIGMKNSYQKVFLILAITINLGLLFVFKYLDFAITNINLVANLHIPLREIALPIGISFFTFQSLSYIVDLYRGEIKVQKNIFKLALYIAMFPQLIAGPIVRYQTICDEIDERVVSIENLGNGVRRFICGLAKKVLLANVLGEMVDVIFSIDPHESTAATLWIGAIAYTLQIFFDFSGYSDMAIGLGEMLGFHFCENFNQPYRATSIADFWRRWHMSLSTFFRDYVYFPLGGSRKGNVYINLAIVFLLTGIWHGASWTFIIWGVWHGIFRIFEYWDKKHINILEKMPKCFGYIITMLIVTLGWVLFRADNIGYAIIYIKGMFGMIEIHDVGYTWRFFLTNQRIFFMIVAIVISLVSKDSIQLFMKSLNKKCRVAVEYAKNICILGMLLVCVLYVVSSTYNPFLYFRF